MLQSGGFSLSGEGGGRTLAGGHCATGLFTGLRGAKMWQVFADLV